MEYNDVIKKFILSDLCKDFEDVILDKSACKNCIVVKLCEEE